MEVLAQKVGIWPIAVAGVVISASLFWPKRRNRSPTAYAGKRIVITGASSGLGEELAYKYAALGASLVLGARREDKLNTVAQKCKTLGAGDVLSIKADFSIEADCKRFIETIIQKWQGFDILILNAGIGGQFRVEDVKDGSNFKEIFNTNVYGYVNTTIYALPHLLKNKGQIVAISSLLGKSWGPTRSAYSASKHALDGFFNSLRCEVDNRITITTIYPGFFISELHSKLLNEEGSKIQNVKRDLSQFMSVEEATRLTLDGIEDKRRELVMTYVGHPIIRILSVVFPSAVDKIVIRKIKSSLQY